MTEVWVWLAVSAAGLLVSSYLTHESVLDLQALPPGTNGRRSAAISRLTREALRATVHVGYILAALAVLQILPHLRPFVVPFLIYGNVVLLVNSVIDAQTRRHLFDTRETDIEREDREAGVIRRHE